MRTSDGGFGLRRMLNSKVGRLAVAALAAAAVLAAILLGGSHGDPDAGKPRLPSRARAAAHTARKPAPPKRLVEHGLASLASPVQDAAAVAVGGGRVMLLGGLTAADTSRADIGIVAARGD